MKEKTKELADSVGAVYPVLFMGRHDGVLFTETELETFVDLAVAAEREACAKMCDYVYNNIVTDEHIKDMAFKIRARGETK